MACGRPAFATARPELRSPGFSRLQPHTG